MFTRIVISALFAGVGAGLAAALLQLAFVQPVLLQAELFESGELVHFGAGSDTPAAREALGIDPVRDGLSVIFSMLIYCGYGLMLVAAMSLAEARGAVVSARTGLLWGLAGFVAVQLAPAFSLAPEVPGAAAGDLAARQVWWFATVGCAAVAMALIGFGRSWLAWGAAAALLLAPHLVGAPEPEVFTGPAPTEVGALFAARALGTGLAAWVLLGCLAGHFWAREGARAGSAQPA